MAYENQMVTWPMTSRDPKGQTRDPNTLRAQYLENSHAIICSEYTQGLIDSDNVEIRYLLRSMT